MVYKVLTANSMTDLVSAVSTEIDKGWKPTGGISVVDESGKVSPNGRNVVDFYQAMVKE